MDNAVGDGSTARYGYQASCSSTRFPPTGVQGQSLEVKDGTVYIDFNSALDEGVAGSCRVLAIRSQITETLKAFSDTDQVVISINGDTESILQP